MIKINITILLLLFLPTTFAVEYTSKIPPHIMYGFIGRGAAEILSQTTLNLKDERVLILTTVRLKSQANHSINFVLYRTEKNSIYRCKEFLSNDYTELKTGSCWLLI